MKLNSFRQKAEIQKWGTTGTGKGIQKMQGTRGTLTRISWSLLEDSREFHYFKILGNVPEDSGEC